MMRFTLTAWPGLAFVRSKVATRLSGVMDWIESARPVTLTLVLVGGLMTTRLAGIVNSSLLTVSVLKVGGVCEKATAPSIRTDSPRASSFRRQLSVTQFTFAARG